LYKERREKTLTYVNKTVKGKAPKVRGLSAEENLCVNVVFKALISKRAKSSA